MPSTPPKDVGELDELLNDAVPDWCAKFNDWERKDQPHPGTFASYLRRRLAASMALEHDDG